MNALLQNPYSVVDRTVAAMTLLSGLTTAGQSQAPDYNVQASVLTVNMPGAYSLSFPCMANTADISLSADPAGIRFNNGHGDVFADTAATAASSDNGLSAYAFARAEKLTAVRFPNYPTSTGSVRFADTITVTSATLPKGAPVALMFDSNAGGSFNGQDLYLGEYYAMLTVNGLGSTTRGSRQWDGALTQALGAPILVKTRVGERFTLKCTAYARACALYFTSDGPTKGQLEVTAQMKVTAISLTPGASVKSDAGRRY